MDTLINSMENLQVQNVLTNNPFENFEKFINEIDYNDSQKKILDNLNFSKLYLVDYVDDDNNNETCISLLGDRKKVGAQRYREKYNIIFNKENRKFTCECKDFLFRSHSKNIVCKHISFLVCKVLKIYNHDYFKTKIAPPNTQSLLTDSNIWTNNNISIKFLNHDFIHSEKTLNINDRCPICYDQFGNFPVLNCPTCKNFIHNDCIQLWLIQSNKCCYCRSTVWEDFKDPHYI